MENERISGNRNTAEVKTLNFPLAYYEFMNKLLLFQRGLNFIKINSAAGYAARSREKPEKPGEKNEEPVTPNTRPLSSVTDPGIIDGALAGKLISYFFHLAN
jgi:hypothetical protein